MRLLLSFPSSNRWQALWTAEGRLSTASTGQRMAPWYTVVPVDGNRAATIDLWAGGDGRGTAERALQARDLVDRRRDGDVGARARHVDRLRAIGRLPGRAVRALVDHPQAGAVARPDRVAVGRGPLLRRRGGLPAAAHDYRCLAAVAQQGVAVAGPAGRRVLAARAAQELLDEDAVVDLAEDVLIELLPAGAERRAQVRQRHGNGRDARLVLLGVEDLRRRLRWVLEEPVHLRTVAGAGLDDLAQRGGSNHLGDEARPLGVREVGLLDHHQRQAIEVNITALGGLLAARLLPLGPRQRVQRVQLLHDHRIALEEGGDGQVTVGVVRVLRSQGADVEVLVLQGVGELVGQGRSRQRAVGVRAGDDVELLGVGVVLAEHDAGAELQLQVVQVDVRREQPERHHQPAAVLHGLQPVGIVQVGQDLRAQLFRREEVAVH